MKKRIEITIDTERFLVVSQRRERSIWCSVCEHRVAMLTVDEAATAAHTTPHVISELAETGQLHFAVLEGQQFICPNSLVSIRA
jgi:hypothetical protein